jgi:hypothetical protein
MKMLVSEYAKKIEKSTSTVYTMIRKGTLETEMIDNKKHVVIEDEVVKAIAKTQAIVKTKPLLKKKSIKKILRKPLRKKILKSIKKPIRKTGKKLVRVAKKRPIRR